MKKLLTPTLIIIASFPILLTVFSQKGTPQSSWKALNLGEDAIRKASSTQEVYINQQEEHMKLISTPGNKSDTQGVVRGQENTSWRTYTKTSPQFSYSVEYPSDWSVAESGNTSFFIPSHTKSKQESVTIVVFNYKQTPPLPVHYTYTRIRTVRINTEAVLVRKRDPSSATEKYFAEIKKGDYTAEFRFSLDHQYDDVFDHMLSTFSFIE
jgi:hypothetical protein